jgi:UDP-N-acetyl-D-mannosaminuronic acid transferase (WecB/TagA/CpsF family)
MYIIGYSYSSVDTKRVLLVTGNFTIDGERSNVAQYDLKSATWSSNSNSQLFLYGEDNGVIWDIAVNYSDPYNRLYTVGLFDTVTKESQVQLCSVARFDGINFEKVTIVFSNLTFEIMSMILGWRRTLFERRG